MSFNYEQSIWGMGQSSLSWFDPTKQRLGHALNSLSSLKNNDKVLEVGCGAGQFIRSVKKMRPQLNCYGCDISSGAITKAKQFDSKINYEVSQPNIFPYPDKSFQAVLIFDVLEHVEDVEVILQEVNRVLVDGGVFHCFVPCEGDWLSVWNALEKLNIVSGLTKKYAGHIQKFSRASVLKILKSNGFEIKNKKYSSHCVGQWLDVAVFLSMDRASKKNKGQQINNEKFFSELNNRRGGVFASFKKLVNLKVNLEGSLLSCVPSPNIHVTYIKK